MPAHDGLHCYGLPMKRWMGCLLLATLAGCAGPETIPTKSDASRSSIGPLTLSLQTETATPGRIGIHPVMPNDKLHNGDGLAFTVEVDRPAYVYLVWYSPTGWSSILFPKSSEQLISPSVPLRIPVQGQWIPLDANPGNEDIYVVASTRSWQEAEPGLREQLRILVPGDSPERGESPPKPEPKEVRGDTHKPEPRPEGVPAGKRGGNQTVMLAAHKILATADKKGVALLRLSFQHIN